MRGDDLTDHIASIREKMRPDRYFGRRVVKWKNFLWILGKKAELATVLKRQQETLRECQFLVMQLYIES
jgi:glutamine cyclotransferase